MKLPTALLGYVKGPLRLEGTNFLEIFFSQPSTWLVNRQPQVVGTNLVCVTHLQKQSKFGFLLMQGDAWYKLCFHAWYTFKYQEIDEDGDYVPGTEWVLYFRTPGWRFDFADWKYIFTKGYFPSGHWD